MRPAPLLRLALLVTAPLSLAASPAAAQRSVSGELMAGVALNIPLPLTITQEGQPPIRLTDGRWPTRTPASGTPAIRAVVRGTATWKRPPSGAPARRVT